MKKKTIIIIPIAICLIVFVAVYFYFNHEDKNTSLTVLEKRWIESNNSTKVNLDILNDYPILGKSGVGVLFDFAKDFEMETGLAFNKTSYSKEVASTGNELKFRILSNDVIPSDKDLLLMEDGYILISKENVRYDDLTEIDNKIIGTLTNDVGEITYYTKKSKNVTYKSYDTVKSLISALDDNTVNIIAVPQFMYLDDTMNLNNKYVNYYMTEMTKKIVLTLTDGNQKLNSIVKKYFENWKNKNYVNSYNKQYLDYYINVKNITDKDKTAMLTKNYSFGYVENAPYQVKLDGKVYGVAGEYVERLKRLTGIDVTYKEYKSKSDLAQGILAHEVDFYFDDSGLAASEFTGTMSPFVEKYVIISKTSAKNVVTSFEGLKNKSVNILDTNLIFNYFRDNSKASLNVKHNIDDLKGNDLIAIDKEVYEYFKDSKFTGYEVLYEGYITNDYKFYVHNNLTNFYNLFNYIMGTNSYYNYRNQGLSSINVSLVERTTFEELYLIVLGLVLLPVLMILAIYLLVKRKKKVKEVRKEDRRKYTDMLTSLKNRNYLNLHMEEWGNISVRPQSIIVVDLNNIKYVNDNYGHEEGDKLIAKAASILVNTQLENSEIIRTDGNEFLIYLIGYSEKQTDVYTKKLTKEFKTLTYGFGATVGYSMIEDDIKTLEDAINEAVLDVKNKKESN